MSASVPRFIPAHAGNTAPPMAAKSCEPVHPRARGKHLGWTCNLVQMHGSSPRTRETPMSAPPICRRSRFIPAHAGNTTPHSRAQVLFSVHPRARGKHLRRNRANDFFSGSSPRTRETPMHQKCAARQSRFIPAHAGNTHTNRRDERRYPVHPRARGKHNQAQRHRGIVVGSSPRTRETHQDAPKKFASSRFIPAHAGNTREQ